MKNIDLNEIRKQIDLIDENILDLLDQRAQLALTTSAYKASLGDKSIFDSDRELKVMLKVAQSSEHALSKKDRVDIFKSIVRACRNIQYLNNNSDFDKLDLRVFDKSESLKISVQGDVGSHSQKAAETYFKPLDIKYDLLFGISSAQVVKDLCDLSADLGVVAISNSNAGLVNESLEALLSAESDNKVYNKLKLNDYFLMPVQHSLLALPDVNIEDISAIYSHPQAIGQCKQYLAKHYPNIKLCECEDTAKAARDLSEKRLDSFSCDLNKVAVIANEICKEHYGLNILDNKIQDDEKNATGFLVIQRANFSN